jgi:hypothetical protein
MRIDRSTNPAPATIDEIRDRLRRAGWSLGETVCGGIWRVDGRNGENVLLVRADAQLAVWKLALVETSALGMVADGREP